MHAYTHKRSHAEGVTICDMFAPDAKPRASRAASKAFGNDAAAVKGKGGGGGKPPEPTTRRRPSQSPAGSRPATYGAMKRWAKQLKVGSRTAGMVTF